MDKLAETYQKGIAKIKAKDYQQAMAFLSAFFKKMQAFCPFATTWASAIIFAGI